MSRFATSFSVWLSSISKYRISPPDRAITTCRSFAAAVTMRFWPGTRHSFVRRGSKCRMPVGWTCT
jgi:hypothetical protein